MHPPEPTYPCYLPVLGEFSRMTPHEGLGSILAESEGCLEPARQLPVVALGAGVAGAGVLGAGVLGVGVFAAAFWMA